MWRTIGKTGLVILGLVALVIVGFLLFAQPAADQPFFSSDEVLVMAHRGGRRLWPENTLYAFQHAAELGVDVLEMDVHSTQDGALVVIHDDTVDRTTNGVGEVQTFSLAELQALDAGYQWSNDDGATYPFRGQSIQIPTLEQVFQALPGYPMNIEIKQREPDITGPVCDLIRQYEMTEKVLIASFDTATIQAFREVCPEEWRVLGGCSVIQTYRRFRPITPNISHSTLAR